MTHKASGKTVAQKTYHDKGKQARYRGKLVSQGRCPRCGTQCAPYYLCPTHRDKRRTNYAVQRLVTAGELIKTQNGYAKAENPKPLKPIRCLFYKTKPDDIRNWPRIGKKYIDLQQIIIHILQQHGPLTEEEITAHAGKRIAKIKEEITKALLTPPDKGK